LILSGNTLYGTTASGGSSGNGTVFAVNTDGSVFTNLYSFTGGNDGGAPRAGLILSGNTLYGTTTGGGSSGYGTYSRSHRWLGFHQPVIVSLATAMEVVRMLVWYYRATPSMDHGVWR